MKTWNMKKLLLVPSLVLFATGATWAWTPPPKPDFSKLYEQWQLTPEQIEQLEGYFQQHQQARKELREQHKALMREHRDNLATVLSEEQLQELRHVAREQRHTHRHHKERFCKGEHSAQSSEQ